MKKIAILGLMAVVGVTASVLWRRASEPKPPPEHEHTEPEPVAQASLERRELRELHTHVVDALKRGAKGEVADDEPVEEPAPRPAPLSSDERNKRVIETTKSTLDRALAMTSPSSRWTQETVSTLRERLAEADFNGSRLEAVACTEALCKINLRHNDQDSWMQFRQALRKPPFVSNTFFSFDVTTGQSVIYTAPRGQDLPPVGPPEG